MNRRVCTLASLALLVPVLVSAQKQTKVIFANVADRTGAPVLNLTPADLEVAVEGIKRTVTRVTFGEPMRIVILVDSGGTVAAQLSSFRGGLNALLDGLSAEDEIAVVSTGGQARVRQAPTTDRKRLHAVTDGFVADGGGNVVLDGLLEIDKRFLKNAPDRWPVFVILTTDSGESRVGTDIDAFNAFVHDFTARGGSAHAMVLHGQANGLISDAVMILAQNTGGVYDAMSIGTALPDKMKALAARIVADHQAMANRYKIEYIGDAKATQPVEVRIPRDGVTIQMSARRPF